MTTNPSPPDWRGLCGELVSAMNEHAAGLHGASYASSWTTALTRARAALAQPEPEVVGPTMQLPEQAPDEHPPSNLDRREVAAWYHGHGCGWQAARAVLARYGRPAPARPPEPEVVGLGKVGYVDAQHTGSDREMLEAFYAACRSEGGTADEIHLRGLRAVLARFGGRPAPATAGEVGELAALIRQIAMAWAPDTCLLGNMTAGQLTRAAELLERQAVAEESSVAPVPVASDTRYEFSVLDADCTEQAGGSAPTYAQALSEGQHYLAQYQQDGPHTLEVRRVEVLHPDALPVLPEGVHVIEPAERTILVPAPVPVAVSERPWEREGWCDEDGRCWMGRRRIGSDPGPRLAPIWALQRPDTTSCFYSHALPFNALPLPSGEVE